MGTFPAITAWLIYTKVKTRLVGPLPPHQKSSCYPHGEWDRSQGYDLQRNSHDWVHQELQQMPKWHIQSAVAALRRHSDQNLRTRSYFMLLLANFTYLHTGRAYSLVLFFGLLHPPISLSFLFDNLILVQVQPSPLNRWTHATVRIIGKHMQDNKRLHGYWQT